MELIVVGATSTPTSEDAASQAAGLAKALGARLHVVSVVTQRATTQVHGGGESWVYTSRDEAQQRMSTLRVALGDGFELTTGLVEGSDPAKALCSEAERLGADLIVVGSVRTQGVGRVLGSVATDVIRRAPCSVLVAKTT